MLNPVYQRAVEAQNVVRQSFRLGQQIVLDGQTTGIIVGKTVDTNPMYDVRVQTDGASQIVLYVQPNRIIQA